MIAWTRIRLTQWGRWARGGLPSVPTMSSTERARMGRGGRGSGPEMPEDITEVDRIVSKASAEHRLLLVVAYVHVGTWENKARRLGLSRWAFRRKLDSAEWFVHTSLDQAAQKTVEGVQHARKCIQPRVINSVRA